MVQPTKGGVFSYAVETALGTSGTFYDIRYNETIEFPTSTRQLVANPNVGHMHGYDQSDKPIAIQKHMEGAGKFSQYIRRANAQDAAAPLAALFESAGCNVATNSGTTLDAYTSTTDFSLSADDSAVGQAGLLELDSGTFYPVLTAAYSSTDVTPSMAIPSAASTSNQWEVMTTIWPRSRQVPSTKTLSFQYNSRGTHTSGEDLYYDWSGCALSAVDDMVIRPFEPPILGYSFHVGKVTQGSSAISAESFVDGEKFAIINDNFCFETANASSSGGIARGDGTLLEASITWGFATVPIPGEGDGTYAGIQGYMHQCGIPRLKITATFSKDYWTQLEGSNTSQYIGLVQPTTAIATPAFGFWMPNAHIDPETPPVVDWSSADYVTATVTYIASSAGYDSDTLNSEAGAAPWYFAISGDAS